MNLKEAIVFSELNPVYRTGIKGSIVGYLTITQADIVFQMVSALFLTECAQSYKNVCIL